MPHQNVYNLFTAHGHAVRTYAVHFVTLQQDIIYTMFHQFQATNQMTSEVICSFFRITRSYLAKTHLHNIGHYHKRNLQKAAYFITLPVAVRTVQQQSPRAFYLPALCREICNGSHKKHYNSYRSYFHHFVYSIPSLTTHSCIVTYCKSMLHQYYI